MEQNNCCCCGVSIGRLNTSIITFHGHELSVCEVCGNAFEKIASGNQRKIESGKKYLRARLEKNEASPIGIPLIQETLGETIDADTIEKVIADLPSVSETTMKSSEVSSGFPLFGGICFLLLSVYLYFVSTNNSYGVANIQATTFSAASFVSAIVSFGTSAIIKAINSKK